MLWLISSACSTAPETETDSVTAHRQDKVYGSLTPEPWRAPGTWDIEISTPDEQPMGNIVLRFTAEPAGEDLCADTGWYEAIIMEDNLDYDLGEGSQAAYLISGPWLTIDLSADACNVDHKLVGQLFEDRASGNFNYIARFGGRHLGKFVAEPIVQRAAP